MRNMFDPNLSREDAQDVPITPDAIQSKGAETVISGSNSNDSQREPILRSTEGCPYHAMLEQLGIWPE
jgi:hypothetical protein